ncbi:copper oxidase [Kitasatospora cheerisanensis KCTC 2395]|uniref:Copper oxidase n=1 Tax=Kitasatospora cheerisanensis KCTC 2395 TaxID=1348663 RepID=A0A066YT91_9ACTN|nr:multicopper oxidase domain-containing protein [Kitasatospora cheerisanensis]KDN81145.1 copper oxidase [Kitasatospora cheerisanensis KCTC 2395]
MNRRTFLALAALTGAAGPLTACGSNTGTAPGRIAPPPPDPSNPLRIPMLLHPEAGPDGVRTFELAMAPGRFALLPGRPTTTWGFNGPYLGPTLRASRGDRIAMTVRNQLPEATTVHWHGTRLPAAMDGGPHQLIEPGAIWTPSWTLDQPAATTWYHPHPHGETAQHIYRGLAGLFIIDDDQDPQARQLPSGYGIDDIPLILQDKTLTADGALDGDPLAGPYGILGDRVLVNGTTDARFDVTTARVRLRLLNASNARLYNLAFADGRPFRVIATDGGLLPAPVETGTLALSPGERAEVLVDFTPGDSAVLRTVDDGTDLARGDFDLLRFVAAARLRPAPALPATLGGPPRSSRRTGRRSAASCSTGVTTPSTAGRWTWTGSTRWWPPAPSRSGRSRTAAASRTTSTSTRSPSNSWTRTTDPPPGTPAATRTPSSCRPTAPSGWPSSSARTATRSSRTCTTATCCGTRTAA